MGGARSGERKTGKMPKGEEILGVKENRLAPPSGQTGSTIPADQVHCVGRHGGYVSCEYGDRSAPRAPAAVTQRYHRFAHPEHRSRPEDLGTLRYDLKHMHEIH